MSTDDSFQVYGYWQERLRAATVEFEAAVNLARPSTRLRPAIMIDGDKWCALYGENLQDGVAGFGDSPEEAFAAFDQAWVQKLPVRQPEARAS